MSVVIVGGNERMVCQYEDICKGFGCKAKSFLQKKKGAMKKKDRCAGSDDSVYKYRFPQNGKLCSRRSKEKNPSLYAAVTQAALQLLRIF